MKKPNKKSELHIPRSTFFDSVAAIIEQARAYVGRTADLAMCVTYFEPPIRQTMSDEFGNVQSLSNIILLVYSQKGQSITDLFKVSWTHYVVLQCYVLISRKAK